MAERFKDLRPAGCDVRLLGIEGTAHTLGVALVDSTGATLAAAKNTIRPPGNEGIHPREAADHHARAVGPLVRQVLDEGKTGSDQLAGVAFSQGPGLGPCLRVAASAARALSASQRIPLCGVNHAIAHLEMARWTTHLAAPLCLYVSGGNTQVLVPRRHRYEILGETIDIGLGNAFDKFGRACGLGWYAGPIIETLAARAAADGAPFRDLPYTVKGMDVAFSGIVTAATHLHTSGMPLPEVCHSLQETAFAMLMEVAERGLAATGAGALTVTGGVACNGRLRQMLESLGKEWGIPVGLPPAATCVDNGEMIALVGLHQLESDVTLPIDQSGVIPRYRTDVPRLPWLEGLEHQAPSNESRWRGAEAEVIPVQWQGRPSVLKHRLLKASRHPRIDLMQRRMRTRSEARVMTAAAAGSIPVPALWDVEVDSTSLLIERLEATLLEELFWENVDGLDRLDPDETRHLARHLGATIAHLHALGIIHGDLTGRNVMISGVGPDCRVWLIDWGLGRFTQEVEDRAVDLRVMLHWCRLRGSLGNTFAAEVERGYHAVLPEEWDRVAGRLQEIETRMRYA